MRISRTRAGLAILSVGLMALTACGGSSSGSKTSGSGSASNNNPINTTKTLTIAETVAPVSFDPQATNLNATWLAWELSYQCLMISDATGAEHPQLATGYTASTDGLTYTFTLRSGVKFHNGNVLTPDDVVYTFQRLQATGLAYYKTRFASLTSVTASGTDKVVFQLSRIDPGFLLNLSDPSTAGCAILNRAAATAADPALKMVGTGPLAVDSYAPNSQLVLHTFADFWGTKPKYAGLVVRYIPDSSAQMAALKSGQVDLTFPTGTTAKTLEADSSLKVDSVISAASIAININSASKPLQDVRVRQAVELAMNRDEIVSAVLLGGGSAAGLIPVGYPWAPKTSELDNYTLDVAKAKSLLADAGYASGLNLEFQYIAGYNDYIERLANVMASELSKVGITLKLSPLPQATWLTNLTSMKYDITYDAYPYFSDPLYYVLIRGGRSGPTPDQIVSLTKQAQAATSQPAYQTAIVAIAKAEANLAFGTFVLANTTLWVAHGKGVNNVKPDMSNTRQFLFNVTMS
jgi:ABC-type transport system substrate-binding protein